MVQKNRPLWAVLRPVRALSLWLMPLLWLSGCSTTSSLIRELPPPELLRDCPSPVVTYRTNGELAEAIIAWRNALAKCNIDKATLREWAGE